MDNFYILNTLENTEILFHIYSTIDTNLNRLTVVVLKKLYILVNILKKGWYLR